MMRTKSILLLLLLVLLSVIAYSWPNQQKSVKEDLAADFTLETIAGEKITLSAILEKKRAVLIFWATWCPYCRTELPIAEKFYAENKTKVEVIGIDIRESKAKVENFLQTLNLSYPIALDSDGKVAKLYKARGVPAIVAVDKNSKIIYDGHSVKQMMGTIDFKQ